MTRRAAITIAFAASLSSLGCAGPPRPIQLGPPSEWILPPERWNEVRERYTRHAHLTNDFDTALDAEVILLAPELRAALAGRVAGMRNLPAPDRDRLVERAKAASAAGLEVLVMLQTSRWEWNDLASPASVWTIVFSDDAGRQVASKDRRSDDSKPTELSALYPGVTPFTRAWIVRFPPAFVDGTPLLREDARRVTVKFAGPLGEARLSWDAR